MQLTIDGRLHTLTPLSTFQAQHGLAESFGTVTFEPDTIPYNPFWAEKAALHSLGQRVLQVVPNEIQLDELNQIPQQMALVLQAEIIAAAAASDVTLDDIELTVTDWRNAVESAVYKLIELSYRNKHNLAAVQEQFDMDAVYQEFIDSTVRVEADSHSYGPQGEPWDVRVIYTQFGAVGLAITTAAGTEYVADGRQAFPAAAFIKQLALDVGRAIAQAYTAH